MPLYARNRGKTLVLTDGEVSRTRQGVDEIYALDHQGILKIY